MRAQQDVTWLRQAVGALARRTTGEAHRLELARELAHRLRTRVERHDTYTKEHSVRVAAWSKVIAHRLPTFDRDRLARLEITALVHDYGKIAVRGEILNKPTELTALELEEVRRHPVLGVELLEPFAGFVSLDGVLNHHRRYEGGGYPGTAGAMARHEIPLEARIVSVADVFDALTSSRSYRGGVSPDRAMAILRQIAGTQLDPALVDILEGFYLGAKEAKGWEVGAKTMVIGATVEEDVRRAREFLRRHVGEFDRRAPLAKVTDSVRFLAKAVEHLQSVTVSPESAETIARYAYKLPQRDTFAREDVALSDLDLERRTQEAGEPGTAPGHREVTLPLRAVKPEYRAVDVAVFAGKLWKVVGDGLRMVLLR